MPWQQIFFCPSKHFHRNLSRSQRCTPPSSCTPLASPEPLSPEPALLLGALAGFLAAALFNPVPGWPSFASHPPWARGGSSLRLTTLESSPSPLDGKPQPRVGKAQGSYPLPSASPTLLRPRSGPPLPFLFPWPLSWGGQGPAGVSHADLPASALPPCDPGPVDPPPTRWSLPPNGIAGSRLHGNTPPCAGPLCSATRRPAPALPLPI